MQLREINHIPGQLLATEATGLEALLGGPTLIHLQGRKEPPLFISVLMHGDETTGWDAARALLQRYSFSQDKLNLPRSVSLFIGNVTAAAKGLRRLDNQPDYNRIWPGCSSTHTAEHALMQQVTDSMIVRGLFASVDIHNNTGLNPHYACINVLDNRFLHLATMFSRTVVYFLRPKGVQSMTFSKHCPSVTLECGKSGQHYGVNHAMEYLDACLHLSEHPDHPVAKHDIELFRTVAIVKVLENLSFGFGEPGVNISFAEDLDRFNFRELPRGTLLGHVAPDHGLGLEVRDEHGRDVAGHYFVLEDGELKLRTQVMPSMLTNNHRVIRQDCLCYLMERMKSTHSSQ